MHVRRKLTTLDPLSFSTAQKSIIEMPSVAQKQPSSETKFCLPDLVAHCPLPARLNRHHKQACAEADRWFICGAGFTGKKKDAFIDARSTFLSTRCYPLAAYPQMRVICDCVSWFFYIDDISDEMSSLSASEMAADIMNTLWHTDTYEPHSRVAKMCKEYVSCHLGVLMFTAYVY